LNRFARVPGLLCALACARAFAAPVAPPDLADLSLEELATITVTSVSRRAERARSSGSVSSGVPA